MQIPISNLDNPIPIAVSNEFCNENIHLNILLFLHLTVPLRRWAQQKSKPKWPKSQRKLTEICAFFTNHKIERIGPGLMSKNEFTAHKSAALLNPQDLFHPFKFHRNWFFTQIKNIYYCVFGKFDKEAIC